MRYSASLYASVVRFLAGIALMVAASVAQAVPFDFLFSVPRSVTLKPGETGYLYATLTNTGEQAVTFQPYDATNPIGGLGWDVSDPGLSISGFGGQSYSPGMPCGGYFHIEGGLVALEPLSSESLYCVSNFDPNFSHLSNVTLQSGESVTFEILSMLFGPDVPLGIAHTITLHGFEVGLGDPHYLLWKALDPIALSLTTGDIFSNSEFLDVPLVEFEFGPNSPPVRVEEPHSLQLWLCALLAFSIFGWRASQPSAIQLKNDSAKKSTEWGARFRAIPAPRVKQSG